MGQRGTWFGCPRRVRELRGPRHQVPPATARGKTRGGVSRRVARGCWEGPSSPPDPQTCPVPALPPFSQPHRPPWARVFEAGRRANLCASRPHLPRRSSLQHDQLQNSIQSRSNLYEKQRQVSRSWLAGCDDGAPSPDAQRDAQQARFHPSPAKAAAWVGPFDALWGGQRATGRCAMQPPLPRAPSLSCVKNFPVWPTVLPPNIAKMMRAAFAHVGNLEWLLRQKRSRP